MKEEIGKFYCPKCQRNTRIYNNCYALTLFRTREEKGKEKRWIFKSVDSSWRGSYYDQYTSIKDCWEETGGFTEEEIRKWENKCKCLGCNYESNSLFTFMSKKEIINSEENNKIKQLEKEIEEEKSRNTFLNEKISAIMKELSEIKIILSKNTSLIKSE